ncbi:hypothetical protein [Oryzobacter telluris]|jgi:hypothetical protein|uniref:hypothetical protein n=1 Tax=Oryzobacter telluris TaxID=3149179 RepID=UPI00370DC6D9
MSLPRTLAVVGLMVLGILALPLLASVLDGQGTENLILPAHLLLMAVVGAVVWRALPVPATADAPTPSRNRVLLVGAVVGVAAAVVGLVFFFLLLSGFSGA